MADIESDKWYYNLDTGEVMQGKQIGWFDRMGPYDSKEEAENALEIAHQRAREADEYDREDDTWSDN
ncbi:SPOR domain-containing protein [Corynebacterium mendelii]|uniref:SPOR domain-containing protein n=1 Tax=Corynebacterium mendelii TaxID=2765362 RepID=A0A939ISQ6_9CORY|nr:SPOR domain-containing protein [Corynebacterium mendelii]MBN9643024.1 SPOR domain-containing protein [Corynebacterium mendelii]